MPKYQFTAMVSIILAKLIFTSLTAADCFENSSNFTQIGGSVESNSPNRSFPMHANWRGVFIPESDLYPRYKADPLRPTMAIQYLFISGSDIPDAGDNRFLHNLGGRFGLLRVYQDGKKDAGFQIDVQAVFIGMFDIDNNTDNIGWDGLYGVLLTWANGQHTAVKFGMQHDSSHLGDEFIERTGRARTDYTREEIVLGLNRKLFTNMWVYTEGAYGYGENIDAQDPWRLQGGVEYEVGNQFLNGHLGWYSAVNVTSYQENDWDLNISVQTGFVTPVRKQAHTLRFGAAYYNGRSIIGEFFQFDEEYLSLGIWMDL